MERNPVLNMCILKQLLRMWKNIYNMFSDSLEATQGKGPWILCAVGIHHPARYGHISVVGCGSEKAGMKHYV